MKRQRWDVVVATEHKVENKLHFLFEMQKRFQRRGAKWRSSEVFNCVEADDLYVQLRKHTDVYEYYTCTGIYTYICVCVRVCAFCICICPFVEVEPVTFYGA